MHSDPERAHPIEAICIGGSHGSFELLSAALPMLPADFPVPILVCMHLPVGAGPEVARQFDARSAVSVVEAEDKQTVQPGHVYIAPGGYHLLVERDTSLSLSDDPPVNHARPSIDVLFESAAVAWGNHLLAVLLTGASGDGARGMAAVAACGGCTVVQDPETARSAVMPRSAIDTIRPDHLTAPADLPELLCRLATPAPEQSRMRDGAPR